jgi:hypothetical protein
LLDRHGKRKLQNFAARSYCFAALKRVFHVLRNSAPSVRHGGPSAKAALAPKRQLTCRAGAPKTRHHFQPLRHKAALRERFRWAMYLFAMP